MFNINIFILIIKHKKNKLIYNILYILETMLQHIEYFLIFPLTNLVNISIFSSKDIH